MVFHPTRSLANVGISNTSENLHDCFVLSFQWIHTHGTRKSPGNTVKIALYKLFQHVFIYIPHLSVQQPSAMDWKVLSFETNRASHVYAGILGDQMA